MTGGSGTAPGAERHRILRRLRESLGKHPAVLTARGHPEAQYTEVTAEVDPAFFDRSAQSATLRVTWYPIPPEGQGLSLPDQPRTSLQAMFTLHYSESSGYDCGFHNEPNPHVEGWLHFQERPGPEEAYEYHPAALEGKTPVSALWELLDELATRLREASA